MITIIGVHGKAGVGKDTFADHLVEKHGFVKRGFADQLYEEVAGAFNVTVGWLKDRDFKEAAHGGLRLVYCSDPGFRDLMTLRREDLMKPRSPREILQLWGTEYRRAQNESYWIDQMTSYIAAHTPDRLVVPDTRFENEAEVIRSYAGGSVVEIVRSVPDVNSHVSEKPLPARLVDFTVYNDSDKQGLYDAAEYTLTWFRAGWAVRDSV